jgi:hypothetical protein
LPGDQFKDATAHKAIENGPIGIGWNVRAHQFEKCGLGFGGKAKIPVAAKIKENGASADQGKRDTMCQNEPHTDAS